MKSATPRIGITIGDPAGIGPEIVARALAADGGEGVFVFGDRWVLAEAAARAGVSPPERIIEVTALDGLVPGRPDERAGAAIDSESATIGIRLSTSALVTPARWASAIAAAGSAAYRAAASGSRTNDSTKSSNEFAMPRHLPYPKSTATAKNAIDLRPDRDRCRTHRCGHPVRGLIARGSIPVRGDAISLPGTAPLSHYREFGPF